MNIPLGRRFARKGCEREAEVLAAVAAGRYDAGVEAHVAGCEACRDLALVVSELRAERDRARAGASVPSAGLIWWRAELGERRQAALKAAAPVTLVQAASVVGAVVLAAALAVTILTSSGGGLSSLVEVLPPLPSWGGVAQALTEPTPLVTYSLALGLTASLLLAPVALYLAFRRD